MPGSLYLCATPIGNLDDLSARALRVLEEVDLIAAEDTRRTLILLNHFGIHKPLTSYYEHNKAEKGQALVAKLLEGQSIALVTDAGTPAISDPGEDLVRLCVENNITVVPVPGCCAVVNALIASGLPTGRFCFEGFLSVTKKSRRAHLDALRNETRTMIFYEAPHKLLNTLTDFYETFGERRITLAREMTKKFEEFVYTTLSDAISRYSQTPPKGEFVLVLEGKTETEEPSVLSDEELREQVFSLKERGHSLSEAAKIVAEANGRKKREVYRMCLEEERT